MKHHFEGFPPSAHPMAILSAMINATGCFYPGLERPAQRDQQFDEQAARLISQVRTIAAYSYRKSPRPALHLSQAATYKYTRQLPPHDVLRRPIEDYELRAGGRPGPRPDFLLLHADHEQNCSHLDRAHGRLQRRQPVRLRRGRRLRPVGTAARRGQPGRDRDAQEHPRGRGTTGPNLSPRPRTGRATSG